jgi:1-acyl-sn-glycerol-3-phosphate acyltransferase
MIRSLWVWLTGIVTLVRYGVPIVWRASRRSAKLRCTCRENPAAWSRAIVRAAGVRVTLEGTEHLSTERAAILVANHQSWFDIFALQGYLPVDVRFVAKKELEGIPVFSASWQACGHISIDRSDLEKAIESLQRAGKVMREEKPTIIMFPEGTRSASGELQPFKKGPFVLAIETGVPVTPTAIVGSRDVMAKGSWRIRPGHVQVRIGAPIPVEGLTVDDREALGMAAHDAVQRLEAGAPLQGPWPLPPSGGIGRETEEVE